VGIERGRGGKRNWWIRKIGMRRRRNWNG